MPGFIPNSNILDALDEVIRAINDLNINLSRCRSCGCGGSDLGLENPITEPTGEGETPTDERFSETDDPVGSSGYNDRKCKISNLIIDDLLIILYELDKLDFEQIMALGTGVAASIVATAISVALISLTGPLVIALSVVGAVTALVMQYINSSLEIDELITIIETNRAGLVCLIYTSTDPDTVDSDFLDELANLGASSADVLLVDVITSSMGWMFLYQKYIGDGGAFESRLDGYECVTDCDGCPDDGFIYLTGSCAASDPQGNENDGDGHLDGIYAGAYSGDGTGNYWECILNAGYTLDEGANLWIRYNTPTGNYGTLQLRARINSTWQTIKTSYYQGVDQFRWEEFDVNLLAPYEGDVIDGVRFEFSSGVGGLTFIIDGLRGANITET